MNPNGYVHPTEMPEVQRYLEGLKHQFMVIYWLGPRQLQRTVTNSQGFVVSYSAMGGRASTPGSVMRELKKNPTLSEPGIAGPVVGLAKYRGILDEANLAQAFHDLMRTFAGPDWEVAPDPKKWWKLFGWLYRNERQLFEAKLAGNSHLLAAQAATSQTQPVPPDYDPEDS
jgi:hypothetical protein